MLGRFLEVLYRLPPSELFGTLMDDGWDIGLIQLTILDRFDHINTPGWPGSHQATVQDMIEAVTWFRTYILEHDYYDL